MMGFLIKGKNVELVHLFELGYNQNKLNGYKYESSIEPNNIEIKYPVSGTENITHKRNANKFSYLREKTKLNKIKPSNAYIPQPRKLAGYKLKTKY